VSVHASVATITHVSDGPAGPADSKILAAARAQFARAPAQAGDPFGIYLHVPFCSHICPYCDFNTYAGQSHRIPEYVTAVCRETATWSPRFSDRRADSIFFGGGTPSLLDAQQVAQIIASCRDSFDVAPDAEVTLEANPNDLSPKYCGDLREAGVNRLSIGAQTLDRRGLRVLGRLHEVDHIARAVAAARSGGLDNFSLDLIYGWPGQTLTSWRSDLEQILGGEVGGAPPDHLSLYELIVEPGTPLADGVARHIRAPVDKDAAADLTELADAILAEAGWCHYEIANWAADAAFASRHNAVYWRNGDYAGIGAGAHGHVSARRTMNQPSPRRYVETVMAGRSPVSNVEVIDMSTAMAETMMLGLRLVKGGVSADAFLARHGVSITDRFGGEIWRLEDQGLLDIDGEGVRLTKRGAMLANSVCAEFLSLE
jgi:oxygen-independent coproporphyrinogen-3 oxidase